MMIKRKVSTIALFMIGSIFIIAGCKKNGCTDANATNYSDGAKKDDESCQYMGSNVFWIHDSSIQKMINDTIQSLTFYVDGDVVGTQTVGLNFTAAPDCGQTGTVTVTRDLFSSKTKAISFRVLDDRSIKRWAGVLTFNGNTCEKNELIYFQ